MSKRPFIVFGLFAAICLIVLPIVALGREGGQGAGPVEVATHDRAAQMLVHENCGSCHTLAAAGIDGIVGPNLDQLLVSTGVSSAEQYQGIYTRVIAAIDCGLNGRMPAGILDGAEAEEAASFIAAYGARIGAGPTVDTRTIENPPAQDCPTGTG